jgi:hypothetical protein
VQEQGLVKVAVRLEAHPEGKTEHPWAEAETLWAQPVGGDLFKLRNIPWETDALHLLDVVRARQSDDGQWDVLELVEPSGHSTIRLAFAETATREQQGEVIVSLEALVGRAEHMTNDHWAVDVNQVISMSAHT